MSFNFKTGMEGLHLKEKISMLELKINSMNFRERVLVLVTSVTVLYFLWYVFLFGALLIAEQEAKTNIQKMHDQIKALETQAETIGQVLGRDPTSALRTRLVELKKINNELQGKITLQTKEMSTPKEMVQVIKHLVENAEGLKLTNLSSLSSKPLFKPKDPSKDKLQVYSHEILLELSGDYFDTLKFLESAEIQRYRVLWNRLNYDVEKYPNANIKILISTLGLEEGFIGV